MDNAIYKSRRINLSEKLPKNSVLLIPGANTQYRNADSAYAYKNYRIYSIIVINYGHQRIGLTKSG